MRILFTLVIGACGSYSPLPEQEGYGVGTWVKIGTPPKPYFLTPDFGSSKSRLFMDGSRSLMPYLEPRAPSSTWVESEDVTYDKMQLVNSVFELSRLKLADVNCLPWTLSMCRVRTAASVWVLTALSHRVKFWNCEESDSITAGQTGAV
jgi:hypothetical protein